MKKNYKDSIKSILSNYKIFLFVLKLRRKILQYIYKNQNSRVINVRGTQMLAPASHPIEELIGSQPLRDINVGIIAKYASSKYPNDALIDIGANIGDTALMMSHNCDNPLILIEGSDYFITYLRHNAKLLSNTYCIHHAILGDGSQVEGTLHHWGGTAFLETDTNTNKISTTKLEDIADNSEICFIKSDTDGNDFAIILSSIGLMKRCSPVLHFEHQVRTNEDSLLVQKIVTELSNIGYKYLIIWDTSGLFAFSSKHLVNLYPISVHSVVSMQGAEPINDVDVTIFHERDYDIFNSIVNYHVENNHVNIKYKNTFENLISGITGESPNNN